MRKRILLAFVLCLLAAGMAQAEEGELGVTVDLSYWSKWLSKGFYGYGSHGALFKTVDLDLYGTGFGVKVTHRNATSGDHVDLQRFDYRPYYASQLFEGESYATNYNIGVGYEHYTGLAKSTANTTYEWILALAWPNLIPEGIVPNYKVHYEYPAGSGYVHDDVTGWVHRFGLGYNLDVDELPAPLQISGEVAYNDGLGGQTKDHDWSYACFGVATKFPITDNLTFVPCVYHQITIDKTTNPDKDVTYCVMSMKYKF
ncbi:MAG: hypothetical protein GY845_36515 [Planctomycetes bacterium]|nr:hypothetical protein [Planctomycetota bacterium]